MPLSSTTCLVFLLLFFFVFNHQNTCKFVTCEVHLRDFKMLENKISDWDLFWCPFATKQIR